MRADLRRESKSTRLFSQKQSLLDPIGTAWYGTEIENSCSKQASTLFLTIRSSKDSPLQESSLDQLQRYTFAAIIGEWSTIARWWNYLTAWSEEVSSFRTHSHLVRVMREITRNEESHS